MGLGEVSGVRFPVMGLCVDRHPITYVQGYSVDGVVGVLLCVAVLDEIGGL